MSKIKYVIKGRIITCCFTDPYSMMYQTYEFLGTKLVGKDRGIDYAMDYMAILEEQQTPFIGPIGFAQCHSRDEFVEEIGKKIALDKMLNKFTERRIRFIQYVMDQEDKLAQQVHDKGNKMLMNMFDLQDKHGKTKTQKKENIIDQKVQLL